MSVTAYFHLAFLALGIRLTFWVGRTLLEHGRVFLLEGFQNNKELADGVNQLLNVGFYLVNVGWICLMVSHGDKPVSLESGIECLSYKVGLVLLALGGMHLLNVYVLGRFRTRAMDTVEFPPVAPDGRVTVRRV